jgi:hypothetical protein
VHEEGLEPSSLAAPEPKGGDTVASEREWSRNEGEREAVGDQRKALATSGGGSVPNQGSARAGTLATLAGELARLSAAGDLEGARILKETIARLLDCAAPGTAVIALGAERPSPSTIRIQRTPRNAIYFNGSSS